MAGRYNTWLRTKLADRIRSNGGYRGHADAALAWTVCYYKGLSGVEEAKELLVGEWFINAADMMVQRPDIDEVLADHFFNNDACQRRYAYAQERLVDDLDDDEGLRMWGPKTAARYGFDYKGDGADRGFDMTLKNFGRGGKHVCLTRFDGENLDKYHCEDLADLVDPAIEKNFNWDPMFSNGWCRKLMGIMDELDKVLTDENAERCGRFYEADWLARELGLFD